MSAIMGESVSSKASRVNVAIRVRPLIERENTTGAQRHWLITDKDLRACDTDRKPILNGPVFTYDNVFTEEIHTKDVYAKVVAPIVDLSFKGFNGTVLCYGQTSSGKTHTLYGCADDKGIIPLFADHLFDRIKADEGKRQYIIKVGLLEIYNEKLTDLLNSENPIDIQERDGRVIPHGLEELTVIDRNHLRKVADRIQRERRIGETRMNKESSRSHTILRVNIESFDLTSAMDADTTDTTVDPPQNLSMTSAVLHFVDLAGSEKQSQTGAEGERLREAIQINKSLSNLSRVIQQLSENEAVVETTESQLTNALCTNKKTAPKSRFVNFRDSKLTRLLQSTLNGEAYISMICNVTPASLEETKSTLNFAKLAKKIQIAPKQNVCSNKTEYEKKLKELQEIIEGKDKEMMALKRQVQNLELSLKVPTALKTQMPVYSANDRRHSLCPALLQRSSDSKSRMPEFVFPKSRYSSSDEVFLSTEETMLHFRQLETIKESAFSDDLRSDKGVQTDGDLELPSTPKKQMLLDPDEARTPAPILRLVNSLLLEDLAQVRTDFEDEKGFLASQLLLLQEDASKAQELQKEVETLKQEKMELENDVIQQMQKSQSQLKRQKEEANEQITALNLQKLAELNSLQESLQISEKRIKSYEEKLKAMEEGAANSEVNKKDMDTSELQSQNKIIEEKIKSQMSDIECLQKKITELEREGVQMKESEQKWMESLPLLHTKVKRLEDRIQDEINESERKQSTIVELESQVAQLEAKLEEQRVIISELQSDKEILEQKTQSQLGDLERLQSKVVQMEIHLAEMKEKEENDKAAVQEKSPAVIMTDCGEQCDLVDECKLRDAIKTMEEKIKSQIDDFEYLQKKVTEIEHESFQLKENEQKWKDTISELRSKQENLEEEMKSQLNDFEGLRSRVTELKHEGVQMKESKLKLEEIVSDMRSKKENLEEELKLQMNDFKRLQNKVTDLEREGCQMKENEQKLMETISGLQSTKEKLEHEVQSQLVDLERLQSKFVQMEIHLAEIKEKEENDKAAVEEKPPAVIMTDCGEQCDLVDECKLRDEIKIMEEKIKSQMSDIERLQNKVTEIERESFHVKENEQKWKEAISELRSNKENLEEELKSQLTDFEGLQSRVMELEHERVQMKESEQKLEKIASDMRSKKENLEEELKSQLNDFEGLQIRVAELEHEGVQMKESEQKLEKIVSDMRSKKENLEEEMKLQMTDFERLQNKVTDLEREGCEIKEKEQKLMKTISGLQSTKEKLEHEVQSQLVDLERLQSKVVQMETHLAEMKEKEENDKAAVQEKPPAVIMTDCGEQCDLVDECKLRDEIKIMEEKIKSQIDDIERMQNKVTEIERESFQLKENEQKRKEAISELRSKKENLEQKVQSQLVDLERLQSMVIQMETHLAEIKEKEENDKAAAKENPAAIIMTNRGEQCDLVDEWKLRDRNKMLKVKSDTLEYRLSLFKKKVEDKDAKIAELQNLLSLQSKGKNLQVSESAPVLKEPNRNETSVEPAASIEEVYEQSGRNMLSRETLPTKINVKENHIHAPSQRVGTTSRDESVKQSKLDAAVIISEVPIPSNELHEAETDLEDSPKAVDDTIAWFEGLCKSTNKENKAPVTSQDDKLSTLATQSVEVKQEKLGTFNKKEAFAPPTELQETVPVYSVEVEDDLAFFNQLFASAKAKK